MSTIHITVGDDVFPSHVNDKDAYLFDFLKTYSLSHTHELVIKKSNNLGLHLNLDGSINLFELTQIEKLIKSSFLV